MQRMNSELGLLGLCIVGFFAVFWLRPSRSTTCEATDTADSCRAREPLGMMLSDQAHAFVDQIAKLLELAGVGTIISGVLIATALFVFGGLRDRCWREAYEEDRSNLGRGILLGLELLVGADIISTITAPNYPAERRVTGGDRSDSDVPESL